jgi:catechol 2,3-dioxygenase-like lactoylglutathione lyase family enzyme
MITNIAITTVFVKDIDASLAFYTDVLGFEVGSDVTLGDYRWTTVCHPSQPELNVHLAIPGPPHSPEMVAALNRALDEGGMHGLGLNVDDCQATYEELKAKGVEFVQAPEERPYGVEAVARDNSGNWMVLVEHKPYDASDLEVSGSGLATVPD